jgi:hypothetical protein
VSLIDNSIGLNNPVVKATIKEVAKVSAKAATEAQDDNCVVTAALRFLAES